MTKFTFDIKRVLKSLENIRTRQIIYQRTTSDLYKEVINSKNVWIDLASDNFNSIAQKDQASLNDALNSIDDYYTNLADFTNELNTIFIKNNGSSGVIEYDSPYISLAKEKCTLINTYLNNAISYLKYRGPSDFSKNRTISNIYSSITNVKSDIQKINSGIKELEISVENLIISHQTRERTINYSKIDSNITRFNWTVVPITRKSSPKIVDAKIYESVALANEVNNANLDLFKAREYTTANDSIKEVNTTDTEITSGTIYNPNDVVINSDTNNTDITSGTIYNPNVATTENIINSTEITGGTTYNPNTASFNSETSNTEIKKETVYDSIMGSVETTTSSTDMTRGNEYNSTTGPVDAVTNGMDVTKGTTYDSFTGPVDTVTNGVDVTKGTTYDATITTINNEIKNTEIQKASEIPLE